MPEAARIGDMHTCPLSEGTKPHAGGPLAGPGVSTVFIESIPAAVAGDSCICTGPTDTIVQGSATVFFGGKPAARKGDLTAHGGLISKGCLTVVIGG